MTDLELFAFVILPLGVSALGWIIVLVHERSLKAARRRASTRT